MTADMWVWSLLCATIGAILSAPLWTWMALKRANREHRANMARARRYMVPEPRR